MNPTFDMVAKTFRGLEEVLAEELRQLGAQDVMPGNRMVSFRGDKAMLYKANMWCRTALRILKPFYTFKASDPDTLYDRTKAFDWSSLMNADKTFSIDSTVYSEEFRNSQFVTYRVKDAIVDWFRDHEADEKRPRVRLDGADIMLNVHISGRDVTLSLDSSGESLHKRGWRRQQTEAPINEVLAAGIILKSGWRGETPFVDPMCGSGTFLIEAALIAANIAPGIYRKQFAFETWPDFDADLLDEIYNDDSAERTVEVPIIGADIQQRALEITAENAKGAGVDQYISLTKRPIAEWKEAPKPAGVLITNPPYGKRITADDMGALYRSIGTTLKHVFLGYHAWIIGYNDDYFHEIGLAPSQKFDMNNGGLECELREYVIFEGTKRDFRAAGGRIKDERPEREERPRRDARPGRPGADERPRRDRDRDTKGRRDERPDRAPRREKPGERFGSKSGERFGGRPGERPERPARDNNRRDDSAEEAPRERKPLSLRGFGRTPSISADKEIVLNRPVWRTRKKKNTDNNDNKE